MSDLLISFYGDDFTGSTDAMESLALAGLPTVLFTRPPTLQDLAKRPDLRAVGVAGMSRALSPAEMDGELPGVFESLKALNSRIVHYKVCSTFDSAPSIGSIGRAIEIGQRVFATSITPVVAGAPALRRHCVFGNLFASFGADGEVFRIDRHPSMSRHPTTPMNEADLRTHLAKQTSLPIGLIDILTVESGNGCDALQALVDRGDRIALIDLAMNRQLSEVGRIVERAATTYGGRFIAGSSGISAALCAYWWEIGAIAQGKPFPAVHDAGPLVVVCGSCSPVTGRQIVHAVEREFVEIAIDVDQLDVSAIAKIAVEAIGGGHSVVLHTSAAKRSAGISKTGEHIGPALGAILRNILSVTPSPRRVLIAGGDTSGHIARAIRIESLEMIGQLTRGAPLCRATARNSPADGVEFVFKGGQIGGDDFFSLVRSGSLS